MECTRPVGWVTLSAVGPPGTSRGGYPDPRPSIVDGYTLGEFLQVFNCPTKASKAAAAVRTKKAKAKRGRRGGTVG
jgi:hypothetical protein